MRKNLQGGAPSDSQCSAHGQALRRFAVRALCAHHRIASAPHIPRRGAARLCGALARCASIYLPLGRAQGAPCKTALRVANAEAIARLWPRGRPLGSPKALPMPRRSAVLPCAPRARNTGWPMSCTIPGAKPFCRARPVRAPVARLCSAQSQAHRKKFLVQQKAQQKARPFGPKFFLIFFQPPLARGPQMWYHCAVQRPD